MTGGNRNSPIYTGLGDPNLEAHVRIPEQKIERVSGNVPRRGLKISKLGSSNTLLDATLDPPILENQLSTEDTSLAVRHEIETIPEAPVSKKKFYLFRTRRLRENINIDLTRSEVISAAPDIEAAAESETAISALKGIFTKFWGINASNVERIKIKKDEPKSSLFARLFALFKWNRDPEEAALASESTLVPRNEERHSLTNIPRFQAAIVCHDGDGQRYTLVFRDSMPVMLFHVETSPQLVYIQQPSVDLYFAFDHIELILSNGAVWATGPNQQGELGLGHCSSVSVLTRLDYLADLYIEFIEIRDGQLSFAEIDGHGWYTPTKSPKACSSSICIQTALNEAERFSNKKMNNWASKGLVHFKMLPILSHWFTESECYEPLKPILNMISEHAWIEAFRRLSSYDSPYWTSLGISSDVFLDEFYDILRLWFNAAHAHDNDLNLILFRHLDNPNIMYWVDCETRALFSR